MKVCGSILKITDRLSLRPTKERPLDFRKLLLDFSIVSREVRLEARQQSLRGAWEDGRQQGKDHISRAVGDKS